jgi:hypothetical protein
MKETRAERRLRDHINGLYADANEPGISDARAEARARMAEACDYGREAIAILRDAMDAGALDGFRVRALLTRAGAPSQEDR